MTSQVVGVESPERPEPDRARARGAAGRAPRSFEASGKPFHGVAPVGVGAGEGARGAADALERERVDHRMVAPRDVGLDELDERVEPAVRRDLGR